MHREKIRGEMGRVKNGVMTNEEWLFHHLPENFMVQPTIQDGASGKKSFAS
jgi:hypothetical protein